MKKYNSPVCEFEILFISDILTASSFEVFNYSNSGNMDDIYYTDRVTW